MIKVAGCWEQGWNTPILEYDLWFFPLKEYGVDEFIMTPVSGIDRKVTEYKDICDVIIDNEDLTIVYVDEEGEEELEDFDHPENALYICGKANFSPMKVMGNARSVRIQTTNHGGRLWPHQAMCLVLDDRKRKSNVSN